MKTIKLVFIYSQKYDLSVKWWDPNIKVIKGHDKFIACSINLEKRGEKNRALAGYQI